MKKLFLLATFIVLIAFSNSWFALNVTTHSSIQTSCNWWTFAPITIYGTDGYHLWDRLNASWEWIISRNSEVSVYINSGKLNVPDSWVQVSSYVPSAGQFYSVWNNGLTTLNTTNLVPADRDQPIAQIVYKIRRMYVWSSNTFGFIWDYIFSPFTWIIPIQTSLWNLNKQFDPSTVTQDDECIAIVPRWCWDWVLDTIEWEQCDPNDASHTGWWTIWCSAACLPTSWWWGSCVAWSITWVQQSPLSATSTGLCMTGVTVSSFAWVVSGNTTTYTWNCGWIAWGNCSATYTTWWGGWGWGGWGWWWGGWGWWSTTFCGDWIIQKPNAQWLDETCDTIEPWCKNCLMTRTNPWEKWPWKITVTNPWQTNSYFSISSYKIIAGNNVPLFTDKDEIRFESSSNLYLWWQEVGIINKANSIVSWTGKTYIFPAWVGVWRVDFLDHKVYDNSGNVIDLIYKTVNYPSNIRLFNGNEITYFKWNTSSFSNSEIYRDTNMSAFYPSQGTNNFYVNVWYIEEAMPIRITKNIVSNVSWWNAYIYNPLWFDVNYIVDNFINKLAQGNFTATSINVRNRVWQNLSSLTSQIISDPTFNNKINETSIKEWNQINSINIAKNSILTDITINNTFDFGTKLSQLWDNSNIRTIKNSNVIIDEANSDMKLSWVKTIIIEDGDLIINRDISYLWNDSSWAFIVKKWNILISKNVSHIAWVYLVMNGNIGSYDWVTEKQLTVEWSLYWNSSNLSDNRTFVKWTEWSSALTTWVIVNYSNRVLKNTPPMLTNFISEYNEKKVAK